MYIHHSTVENETKLNAKDVVTVDILLCACANALSFLLRGLTRSQTKRIM
jgi:hypothetical protein